MPYQMSIKKPVKVKGVNIYTGRKNWAVFHPEEENEGMVFYSRGRRIPASLENAHYGFYAIDIEKGSRKVRLVEHLLSSAYALGIDNVVVELSDGVCPTTDNCAREYFLALKEARTEQPAKKKFWRYGKDEVTIVPWHEGKPDFLVAGPSQGFMIECRNYYPHKAVGDRQFRMEVNAGNYENYVMEARSQGFVDTSLRKFLFSLRRDGPLGGLGWHGINEKNYLIISSKDSESYGNPPGYEARYDGEEFIRHTMKDKIGTLAFTGRQFRDTEFRFNMTGHRFDLYALKELFAEGCFEECE
jgi:UDP-3-O-[3-hydroxymyristoyl] N-acetylglucosamine deacetylase